MINFSMKMIQNECKKHKTYNKECAFYDPGTPNRCFIYANPCDWELEEISRAFNNMIIKNEEDKKRERY